MTKPNLILGLATNYDLAQIEPFIASFVHTVPNTHLCLFSTSMDLPFYHCAEGYDFEVRNARPYLARGQHGLLARFSMFRDYIASVSGHYQSVLITDVRDVIFQGNPFARNLSGRVVFAAEDKAIGNCSFNSMWVREVYGEAVLAELAPRQISCAGTTIGDTDTMLVYLQTMLAEIEVHDFDKKVPYDQGIHNFIVWKLRPACGLFDINCAIIRTLGHTPTERVTVERGKIMVDDAWSPVVHQFDRHPQAVKLVAEDKRFRLEEG